MTTETETHLRELLAKATPGEWKQHQYQILLTDNETEVAVVADTVDCSLIVALHNAAPALLDELEALKRQDKVHWKTRRTLVKDNEQLRERIGCGCGGDYGLCLACRAALKDQP